MSDSPQPGIYLIVEFDWPRPFTPEVGELAKQLHNIVQDKSWIKEVVAASGGIGKGPSSVWIFWLENYAALDTLMNDRENEVSQVYTKFFSGMSLVNDKIRGEVLFI